MDLGPLGAAEGLDAGDQGRLGDGDREDHALAPFDPFGRGDAEAVVGDAEGRQQLDRGVALGRVVEEGDDAGGARAVDWPDLAGSDLGVFHRWAVPRWIISSR